MFQETSAASDRLAILGGEPVCRDAWPAWPIHDMAEESRLLDVLRSGKWWFGAQVQEFEAAYAAFQGAKYAVTCTNGTTAIEMGLRALGVVEGDEVIVPPYSFIATASAAITSAPSPSLPTFSPTRSALIPKMLHARSHRARGRSFRFTWRA